MKNQLKQQIEQNMKIIKTTECTPKIDIQYEEITVPQKSSKPKPKNPPQDNQIEQNIPKQQQPINNLAAKAPR